MRKSCVFLVALVVLSFFQRAFSQEQSTVLEAPDNWLTEIIPFPIGFAPEIDLQGFEDLRFMPNWNDSTSTEFWSYMFVWYVAESGPITEERLTTYFNSYYDGLQRVDERNEMDSTRHYDRTTSVFAAMEDGFKGKIRMYDGFFIHDYITLNVKVTFSECNEQKRQIIRCELSPLPFENKLWETFEQVKIRSNCH